MSCLLFDGKFEVLLHPCVHGLVQQDHPMMGPCNGLAELWTKNNSFRIHKPL